MSSFMLRTVLYSIEMDADTKNNVLAIALEAQQLDLERARMQLEDEQAKIARGLQKLTEEISFVQSHHFFAPSRAIQRNGI